MGSVTSGYHYSLHQLSFQSIIKGQPSPNVCLPSVLGTVGHGIFELITRLPGENGSEQRLEEGPEVPFYSGAGEDGLAAKRSSVLSIHTAGISGPRKSGPHTCAHVRTPYS